MAEKVSGWRAFSRVLERVVVVANIHPDVCFLGKYSNALGILMSTDRISDRRIGMPVLHSIRSVAAAE